MFVLHLQGTASAAETVNRAVRGRYPAGEVTVASVIDLSLVLTLCWWTRGSVWIVLRQAYEKTASRLPGCANPEECVVILPDWGGRVTRAFGVSETAVTLLEGAGEWDGWRADAVSCY